MARGANIILRKGPAHQLAGNAHTMTNAYPGKLIVVEGVDGSGKSTQVDLLYKWLCANDYSVFFSEWNSSPLVKSTTRMGKKRKILTPTTFSLIHATDFANRLENQILPLLKAGVIVLADRYMFTAFARDVARGISPSWVRALYGFSPKPDLSFYFRVPSTVSCERILSGRASIKYYEAGMDIGLSDDVRQSFRLFQQRIAREYDAMADEFGFRVIDGTQPIEIQQEQMRDIVREELRGFRGLHAGTLPRNRDAMAGTAHEVAE